MDIKPFPFQADNKCSVLSTVEKIFKDTNNDLKEAYNRIRLIQCEAYAEGLQNTSHLNKINVAEYVLSCALRTNQK